MNAHSILVRNSLEKQQIGISRNKWKEKVTVNLTEIREYLRKVDGQNRLKIAFSCEPYC
jgi:hypothetical protein